MDDNYKHGLLWQDHQHQQLLSAIYALNRKRDTALESSELKKTLAFLDFYVKSHFDMEEHYMESLGYPEIDAHQKQHAEFTEHVRIFRGKVKSSNDPSLLLTELCNWLKDHIMGVDKDLAEFIKAKEQPDSSSA